jgi:hypothetical protein
VRGNACSGYDEDAGAVVGREGADRLRNRKRRLGIDRVCGIFAVERQRGNRP